MTTDHEQAIQHEINRLVAALGDMALADLDGQVEETLPGFIVGARAARDSYAPTGPLALAWDALAELAWAVRQFVNEEKST